MDVMLINGQEFVSGDGQRHYKVRYAVMPENSVTKFQGRDGEDLTVRLIGPKVYEIKCAQSVFASLSKMTLPAHAKLVLGPDLSNPRYNIVQGVESV
jgi:hypothetical protein